MWKCSYFEAKSTLRVFHTGYLGVLQFGMPLCPIVRINVCLFISLFDMDDTFKALLHLIKMQLVLCNKFFFFN